VIANSISKKVILVISIADYILKGTSNGILELYLKAVFKEEAYLPKSIG